MKKLLCVCLLLCLLVAVIQEANAATVIWCRRNSGDTHAERAADQPWIDHLASLGYNVVENEGHEVMDDAALAELNAADLVIMGRGSNSGAYDDAATIGGNATTEPVVWNEMVTTPIMCMTPYLPRTTRWSWLNTSTQTEVNADPHVLTALDPSHAAFAGVALDGSNQVNVSIPGTERQIELNPILPDAGNGTIVATVAGGYIQIAEWAAGTELIDGTITGGRRMMALLSMDIDDGHSVDFMDGLSPDAIQIFDNLVADMVPEPATLILLGMGGLLIRKRKA